MCLHDSAVLVMYAQSCCDAADNAVTIACKNQKASILQPTDAHDQTMHQYGVSSDHCWDSSSAMFSCTEWLPKFDLYSKFVANMMMLV